MRPRAGQLGARRFVDELRKRRRLLRRASETPHACVDLQMNGHAGFGSSQGFGEVAARHRDGAARGSRDSRVGRKKRAHDKDLLGVDQPSQLSRLFQGRHGQPVRSAFERRVGDRDGAVPIAACLDDREQLRSLRQVTQDAVAVGADRAQVDVRPAQGCTQSPPWRSTFMTSGISGSRSPASSPESPRRCAIRAPAAACT